MRLVTTWFGTFVIDDDGNVLESSPFPRDPKGIADRLRRMDDGELLPEEEELAGGRSLEVCERRLQLLGALTDFKVPDIRPEEHGFEPGMLSKAMVLRGRERVRLMGTPDEQIVQAIRAIDDLTKTINLMSERLHEWQGLNFPELTKLVPELKYVKLVAEHGDRESILESGELELEDSMGSDVTEEDAEALKALANTILSLMDRREATERYVEAKMRDVARNTAHLAGPLIGARLISLSGGLERLSRMPSSTIQLLGAEKALFKHLKDKSRPPKHGVIFQHPMVHGAPPWQRGKVARSFASKIAIAVRTDKYGDRFIGEELAADLERRVAEIQRKYPRPPKRKGRGGGR